MIYSIIFRPYIAKTSCAFLLFDASYETFCLETKAVVPSCRLAMWSCQSLEQSCPLLFCLFGTYTLCWPLLKYRSSSLRQRSRAKLFVIKLLFLLWKWKTAVNDEPRRRLRSFVEIKLTNFFKERRNCCSIVHMMYRTAANFEYNKWFTNSDVKNNNIQLHPKRGSQITIFWKFNGSISLYIFQTWPNFLQTFAYKRCIRNLWALRTCNYDSTFKTCLCNDPQLL